MASGADDRPSQPSPLLIPPEIVAAMVDHCRREAPLECCGLLGGNAPAVATIHPLRNVEASPTRYLADPRDVIAAVVALRGRGSEIVAIYHSHPEWAAVPSRVDLETNYYGDLPRIIVSLLGPVPEVRAWRLGPDSFEEVPWHEPPSGVVSAGPTD